MTNKRIYKNRKSWAMSINYRNYTITSSGIKTKKMASILADDIYNKLMSKVWNRQKRKTFSTATRNKICALQKWRCNLCKTLFDDIFIIDHIVPLYLGGTNDETNLQSLCPSCDKYKSSFMDKEILETHLADNGDLNADDVLKYQEEYHNTLNEKKNDCLITNDHAKISIGGINIEINIDQ